MTHGELCLSFAVPALGLPHIMRGNFVVRVKMSQAAGSEHLPTGNYLSSQKLFREHKQILGARFPRRNTARSTPFLAVAATSERCHCTVSHPLTGISPVTRETLTREQSCTRSRPSQHTQRLPCHALSVAVLCKRPLHTLRKAFTVRERISRSYMMSAGSRLKQ